MKLFFATILGLFFSLSTLAQAPDFDDLKILYADANYEKLVSVTEKYSDKDDTKKDPNVYMWMAKGYYKISVSGEAGDDYKNAFKTGIGALGKAMKYDSDGSCASEHDDFVDQFTKACVERIMNDIGSEDYRKAYGWNIKYLKISQNPLGATYMEGALKFRNSDKGGANTAWKEAETMLKDINSIEGWLKADVELLKYGVIQTAEAYVSSRQIDKARELLNKMAPWFEKDDDFQMTYDKIVN
jgi:hypothetical protein|tara:strand:- start:10099 stop:10824 length:726 start_codon:yes stop_codon:yes gene_type:complete